VRKPPLQFHASGRLQPIRANSKIRAKKLRPIYVTAMVLLNAPIAIVVVDCNIRSLLADAAFHVANVVESSPYTDTIAIFRCRLYIGPCSEWIVGKLDRGGSSAAREKTSTSRA